MSDQSSPKRAMFSTAAQQSIEVSAREPDHQHKRNEETNQFDRPNWKNDIILNAAKGVVPPIVFIVILVAMKYLFRINSNFEGTPLLRPEPVWPIDNAIYLSIDSTILVFIASRLSSVLTFLINTQVALATYVVARRLLKNDLVQENMPTPYQLSLIMKFVNGSSCGGLWDVLMYRFRWKQVSTWRGSPLNYITVTSVLFMFMGLIVVISDIYMHIATETVGISLSLPFSNSEALYGFELRESCILTNNSLAALRNTNTSCTLKPAPNAVIFEDPVTTTQVVNNQSQSITILPSSENDTVYLGPGPVRLNTQHDFVASTFGLRTRCSSISQQCNLVDEEGSVSYNCSGQFNSEDDDLLASGLLMSFFGQANLSIHEDLWQFHGVDNPFYVVAAAANSVPSDSQLLDDAHVMTPKSRSMVAAIFFCEATVLDVDYTSVQGKIDILKTIPSNSSVANMFVSGITQTGFGRQNIQTALGMTAIVANNVQQFADGFGSSLANSILASGAGSVRQVPAQLVQERKEILVTRVPRESFYFAIAVNLVLVVMCTANASIALRTCPEGREAQYRLTIPGIVAHSFEQECSRRPAETAEQSFREYQDYNEVARVQYRLTSLGGFVLDAISPEMYPKRAQSSDITETGQDCRGERRGYLIE